MRQIVVGLLALDLIGCVEVPRPDGTYDPVSIERVRDIRRVEIEPTGIGNSCRVSYPPDPEMRDIRWVTGSNETACRAVADKALAAIEAKGWLCESEESSDDTGDGEALAWRCVRT